MSKYLNSISCSGVEPMTGEAWSFGLPKAWSFGLSYIQYNVYSGREAKGECIWPLSWSIQYKFVCDGRYSGRGRACTPHPNQPGLILPSCWNVRQKVAIATLCTLCPSPLSMQLSRSYRILLTKPRWYSQCTKWRKHFSQCHTWYNNNSKRSCFFHHGVHTTSRDRIQIFW